MDSSPKSPNMLPLFLKNIFLLKTELTKFHNQLPHPQRILFELGIHSFLKYAFHNHMEE